MTSVTIVCKYGLISSVFIPRLVDMVCFQQTVYHDSGQFLSNFQGFISCGFAGSRKIHSNHDAFIRGQRLYKFMHFLLICLINNIDNNINNIYSFSFPSIQWMLFLFMLFCLFLWCQLVIWVCFWLECAMKVAWDKVFAFKIYFNEVFWLKVNVNDKVS